MRLMQRRSQKRDYYQQAGQTQQFGGELYGWGQQQADDSKDNDKRLIEVDWPWPFTNKQERQAEAMSMILAENSYERKMERMAGWVRTLCKLDWRCGIDIRSIIWTGCIG